MNINLKDKEYLILRRALETYYWWLFKEEGELSELKEIDELEHKLIDSKLSINNQIISKG
jgi:hypothetical protein